ncbi:MAG: CDP-diacylglycerol--glycerol-3-phosphate 3-phosphatidyltransferase [Clostridiales Family XIII bacterium]|jgi:CDP-diacylglycerol--glycerol-3-phosphate 3-phosphatidyltransferase|nr:CDP-diacylglycerol--glycerol-3-phosphate 3-phosphatidyltransferase [Clostridiales Family XIII bacterium]
MNLPNTLTLVRIALIPVFVVLLLSGYAKAAAAVFIVASLTDALDGYIARKKNLITNFGKLMDPLADKLLVVSALVCLTELNEIAGWMLIVILAREFMITGLRSVAAGEGIVIAAGVTGKLKTIFQMVAVIALLLGNWPFAYVGFPFDRVMLWLAVILTVYSGVEYMIRNRRVFAQN